MIEETIARWHDFIRGKLPGGLDELLADDIVFLSPVVFTPQKGKDLAKLYLNAAGATFGGDDAKKDATPDSTKAVGPGFRYVKEVLTHPHAVLEFETEVDGKYVNGVDIITCNDEDRIVEFRVMIRPLQAVNTLHARMARMLEMMKKD